MWACFEFECYGVGHLCNRAHFLDRGLLNSSLFIQTILGILGGIGPLRAPVTMGRVAYRIGELTEL